MKKYLDIGYKLLYPHPLLFVLFALIGYGSVICVFVLGLSTHVISYVSYVLSAYALIITVPKLIQLVKWINKRLHSNQYTNRLLTDRTLKNNVNLFSGTFFNVLYGGFKLVTGYIYSSIWFVATGVYYLVLGVMKLSLTRGVIKKVNLKKQITQYRNTGILMFLLNVTMVGMLILMIREGESAIYPGYIIFAQAAYTFYILIFAIINMIRYRKNHTPLITASKSINLVAAVMALFILQVAMINEFGIEGQESFKLIINTVTGSATSLITIGVAVYMIINSKQLIDHQKTLGEENYEK